jgi:hypothetical protein
MMNERGLSAQPLFGHEEMEMTEMCRACLQRNFEDVFKKLCNNYSLDVFFTPAAKHFTCLVHLVV